MAYNLLKGKRGIIFGALDNKSIAWKIAELAHEEGAIFTLSNTATALRFGEINELAEKCNATVITADATSVEDLTHVLRRVWKYLVVKLILCFIRSGCRLMFVNIGFTMI
jgi:enoyl-[acyl-carrier protein] reductase I